LKRLKLKEESDLKRVYYHFVPCIDDASRASKVNSFSASNDAIYIVTLSEMLEPFRDAIKKNPIFIYQEAIKMIITMIVMYNILL